MSTVLWWLARPFRFTLGPMDARGVAAAVLLLAVGVSAGLWAERREIGWATAWPRWLLRRLEVWLENRQPSWGRLALLIGSVNIASMGLIAAASRFPLLVPLLIVATGLNTGVMAQRVAGNRAWLALLMPHAWVELPAVVAGSAAALEAAATTAGLGWFDVLADPVWAMAFWLRVCIPLLIGAAMIEAALMTAGRGVDRT